MSLLKLLQQKKCFKLVCGAGNENTTEVEKLVAVYAKAGCKFFDIAASQEILNAAKRGLAYSIPPHEQSDYHFCVSVGMKCDPHFNKATINDKKCVNCGACIDKCPQNAIINKAQVQAQVPNAYKQEALSSLMGYEVNQENCIGCGTCLKVCENGAIRLDPKKEALPFLLHNFIDKGISCVEIHAMGEDEDEVDEIWAKIAENFHGTLSISLGRKHLSDEKMIQRIKRLASNKIPYTTIIQADGFPISGGADDYNATLQSVACAQIIQEAKLPVYVLLSGGTNTKTAELARQCGVEFAGVSVGSYARKIIRKYLDNEFLLMQENLFNEAVNIAKGLVEKTY